MKQVKKWWVAVLLGLLLVAALGGAVLARSNSRPEAARSWTLIVPAAVFVPRWDGIDWTNYGYLLVLPSGSGNFIAPVSLPGTKRVKSLTLYAYDNNGSVKMCVELYRARPLTGQPQKMGQVCSSGAQDRVRAFTNTNIRPNRVTPQWGTYFNLWFDGAASNLGLYGVEIVYAK